MMTRAFHLLPPPPLGQARGNERRSDSDEGWSYPGLFILHCASFGSKYNVLGCNAAFEEKDQNNPKSSSKI